jgi:hypothetical protein
MPKAGFWAIETTRKISFRKDGWWYANDERIENRRINVLFSRHLHQNSEGRYEIAIGGDRVVVEIEDTPYVVTHITGDPERGFVVRLNDDSEETLTPTTLYVGPNQVLYCRVKNGRCPARFLRPAYYQLATYIHEGSVSGTFFLPLGGTLYQISTPVDGQEPPANGSR